MAPLAVTDASLHLAGLLDSQLTALVAEWSERAARVGPHALALAPHVPALLRQLIEELSAPEAPAAAATPLGEGFDLEGAVRGYGLLQQVVLELLERATVPVSMRDVRRLGDWFTRAISALAAAHAGARPGPALARRGAPESAGDAPEETLRSAGQEPPPASATGNATAPLGSAPLGSAPPRDGELVMTLAHELRNPTAAITTALSLLEQADLDPSRAARYRDIARRQAATLARLADDLLDLERLRRGELELRQDALDLGGIVQRALGATRPVVEAHQHALGLTLAKGAFRLVGDGARLEQVVVNLLTHAAEHTEPGGSISVGLARESRGERPWALLSVRDTGRGIASDMLATAFELSSPLSPGLDRRLGLGLSLPLVKGLVELHGGSVSAHSEGLGHGSELRVLLPLSTGAASGAREPGEERGAPPPVGPRVLVIESSDDIRELLGACLRELGHEVLSAANGLEGAAAIERERPAVALIALELPGIDGYEVARRARATRPRRELRLVALSAYGGADSEQRAQAAGFDRHVTQPVDLGGLRELLASPAHDTPAHEAHE